MVAGEVGRGTPYPAWEGVVVPLKAVESERDLGRSWRGGQHQASVQHKMASHRLRDYCPIAGAGMGQVTVAGYEGWESQGGTNKG